jgi:hypothetical protein
MVPQKRTSEAVIRGSGHVHMDDLSKKAITALVRFQIVMALLLGFPQFWSKKQRSFGSDCISWSL